MRCNVAFELIVAAPVTLTLEVVVPLNSIDKVLPALCVKLATVIVPIEVPGCNVPLTVKAPTVPVPFSVAPVLTVVAELVAMLPVTTKVPAETAVAPV